MMKKIIRLIFLSDYVTKDMIYSQVFFLGIAVFGWFLFFLMLPLASILFAILSIIYGIRLYFMTKAWKQGSKKL